jgi:hypothetical protein
LSSLFTPLRVIAKQKRTPRRKTGAFLFGEIKEQRR